MKILVIATKLPWPACDGGRLVLWETLLALAAQGHAIRLVAPGRLQDLDESVRRELQRVCTPHLVPVVARPWWRAALVSLCTGRALSTVRHTHAAMRKAVATLLDAWQPDVVHVEQLQAFEHARSALRAGVPVLLRMQNVESDLWRQVARRRWRARVLALEAWRLQRDERRAIRLAGAVLTLTEADAQALRRIARATDAFKINAVRPAFPAVLPTAPALPDSTLPLVLGGSSGWWPNTEGNHWFVSQVLPGVLAQLPEQQVYLYGGDALRARGLHWRAAPVESVDAFPSASVQGVVLFTASGIRMRILEAWARGIPVIATRKAAGGLDADAALLLAETPAAWLDALRRLRSTPELRTTLVRAGREQLQQHYDPQRQALALCAHYPGPRRGH